MPDDVLLRRSEPKPYCSDTVPPRSGFRRGLTGTLTLSCLLLLTACAIPVPLQVASWVADGISYLTTEKSVSDHGISAVIGQDCALYRGVTEGNVCRDGETLDITVAAGEDEVPAPENVAMGDPDDDLPSEPDQLSLIAPSGGTVEDSLAAIRDPLLPGECRSAVEPARPGSDSDGPWAILNCVTPAT